MKFSTQIIQIRPDLAQQFIAVLGTQNRVDMIKLAQMNREHIALALSAEPVLKLRFKCRPVSDSRRRIQKHHRILNLQIEHYEHDRIADAGAKDLSVPVLQPDHGGCHSRVGAHDDLRAKRGIFMLPHDNQKIQQKEDHNIRVSVIRADALIITAVTKIVKKSGHRRHCHQHKKCGKRDYARSRKYRSLPAADRTCRHKIPVNQI